MNMKNHPRLVIASALAMVGIVMVSQAPAQFVWDGGGANDDWSTAQNWEGDVAPGNPTTSVIAFNGTTRLTPNVDLAWGVGGIVFQSGAGAFVLGGSALMVGSSGIVVNSSNNQTITNSFVLSNSQTWNAVSGNLLITGNTALGANNLVLSAGAGRVLNITGSIFGSGNLTANVTGTVRLAGANTYSGNTTLTGGTVIAAHNSAFGTGNLVLGGLTLNAEGVRTFSNPVRVNAGSTFTGSNMVFTSGVVLNSNPTLTVNSPRVTWEAGVSETGGARALTKAGTGSLVINSTYTATGVLRINGGTVALGPGVSPPAANLWLSGGVLSMSGNFSRPLGTGAGQVRWTANGGFAAFGGNLNVSIPGTPVWGSTASFLGATQQLLLSSAVADGIVNWTSDFSLGAAGNRTINVGDNAFSPNDRAVISGNISGSGNLVKEGTGRLELTASNSYTGFTQVASGVLVVSSVANAGSPSPLGAGNEIRLGRTTAAGTLLYEGGAASSNRQILLTGTTGGGIISANGAGALTLSGNVSALFTGAKTLTLTGNSTAANTLSGVISNGAGVVAISKTGTGRWDITGANTYTGNTTLSAGILGIGSNSTFGSGNFIMAGGTLASVGGPRAVPNRTLLTANSQIAAGSDITFTGNFINTGGNRQLTVNSGAIAYFTGNVLLSESATNRILTFTGAGNSVVSGIISNGLSSNSALTKAGTGVLVLSGNNTYTGNTTVSAGTLEIRSAGALGSSANPTIVAAGATLATNGTFSTAETIRIAGTGVGGGGALRHLAGSATITGNVILTAAANITSNAGTLTLSPPTGDAVSGNFALTIGGAGDIVLVRRYNIGTAPLVKTGTGSLVLASTATAATSGNITVQAGTFEVNGSIASGGSLAVNSGATLAGDGSINRPTSISGTHAPGAGATVGQQTFSAGLAYNAGSTLSWQLLANTTSGPGTNFDQVLVTGGNLTVNSAASMQLVFNATGSTVDWSDSFWNTNQQWVAVSFTSSGSSTGVFGSVSVSLDSLGQSLASVRPGASFSAVKIGNDVVVLYTIPEPASVGLLGLALIVATFRRKRHLS